MGQFGLGIMFKNGHGVPRDSTEALKWIRLAADQGNALEPKPISARCMRTAGA